jgi:hypothetical protein
MFNNFYFLGNRTIYEVLWKNIVEPGYGVHAHCMLDS